MQRYVKQLIDELDQVAKNPPTIPFFEIPPHMAYDPAMAELAQVPFRSIEEWTGIKMESFPEVFRLVPDQCRQLNEAIFGVYDALNIALVDLPKDMPPEFLYDVLSTNWDHTVQYLPSSGMDMELCTQDPHDCPYGEYCSCNEAFDEPELPARFEALVPYIADSIDAGLVCFLNPETLELEDISATMWNDPLEFHSVTGMDAEEETYEHENWDESWMFEPIESHEAFRIMEEFAENIDNAKFRDKLFNALNRRKPFANFKDIIDYSDYREDWFLFKKEYLQKHVRQLIMEKLNAVDWNTDEVVNGLYNDDGTKIDPETLPLPSLCVICKHHNSDDWEENILCLLNRNDQRDSDEFECADFEKPGCS